MLKFICIKVSFKKPLCFVTLLCFFFQLQNNAASTNLSALADEIDLFADGINGTLPTVAVSKMYLFRVTEVTFHSM